MKYENKELAEKICATIEELQDRLDLLNTSSVTVEINITNKRIVEVFFTKMAITRRCQCILMRVYTFLTMLNPTCKQELTTLNINWNYYEFSRKILQTIL